jgi:hypothetical protein
MKLKTALTLSLLSLTACYSGPSEDQLSNAISLCGEKKNYRSYSAQYECQNKEIIQLFEENRSWKERPAEIKRWTDYRLMIAEKLDAGKIGQKEAEYLINEKRHEIRKARSKPQKRNRNCIPDNMVCYLDCLFNL